MLLSLTRANCLQRNFATLTDLFDCVDLLTNVEKQWAWHAINVARLGVPWLSPTDSIWQDRDIPSGTGSARDSSDPTATLTWRRDYWRPTNESIIVWPGGRWRTPTPPPPWMRLRRTGYRSCKGAQNIACPLKRYPGRATIRIVLQVHFLQRHV